MTDRECVLEIIRIAAGCEAYPLIHERCEAVLREHVARATAARDAEIMRLTSLCDGYASGFDTQHEEIERLTQERDGFRDMLRSLMLTANEVKRSNTLDFMEWLSLRIAQARNMLSEGKGDG